MGHYKDLTETGNRARKVSGTQATEKDAPADLIFTVKICSVCMEDTTLVPEVFLEIVLGERGSEPRRKRRRKISRKTSDTRVGKRRMWKKVPHLLTISKKINIIN